MAILETISYYGIRKSHSDGDRTSYTVDLLIL